MFHKILDPLYKRHKRNQQPLTESELIKVWHQRFKTITHQATQQQNVNFAKPQMLMFKLQ